MKYILALALLFNGIVMGQTTTEKSRKIKLGARASKDALPIPISGIQIVPVCADTFHLGYVQVGMANKRIAAVPDKPLTAFLQDYADGTWGQRYTANGARLLWVVKDLRVSERTRGMGEKAFVRLKAAVFLAADQQHYRQVALVDTILMKGGGMDATGKHGRNIAAALELLLYASNSPAADTGALLSEAQVLAAGNERFNAPVYLTQHYSEGVYRTYQEFLNNTPSVAQFEMKTKRRKVQVFAVNADSSRALIEAPWGICKGDELYKYEKGILVPIERKDNAFIISHYLDASNRHNQAILWSTVAGGLIGGAIAGAMDKQVVYVTSIPYLDDYYLPEGTTIDTDSGQVMF